MKRLRFSKEKCLGCQLCAQVCSAMHEEIYAPSKARIGIETYYEKGVALKYKDEYCTLCGICAKNCPESAIVINDKVEVNFDICTGCGICAEKCAKRAVKIRDGKAYICDTCDGNPICIQVCPQGALRFE